MPVAHMTMNSLWMCFFTSAGSILMISLGTWSGPGALPLLSCLQQSKNISSSRMCCSSQRRGPAADVVASVAKWNGSGAPACCHGYCLVASVGRYCPVFCPLGGCRSSSKWCSTACMIFAG